MKEQLNTKVIQYSQHFTERFIKIILIISALLIIVAIYAGVTFEMKDVVPVKGALEPANAHYIKAPFSGRIQNVLKKDGDLVKKGEILVEFDTSDLSINKLRLQSEITSYESQLQKIVAEAKLKDANRKNDVASIDSQKQSLQFQSEASKKAI